MPAYYNENDAFAAQWLRNLISKNLIAGGDVDERDIRDVRPIELRGYDQCHFFAGIGGWSLALRLAAWPNDRPIWTGSCPCQPFSAAGKSGGFADERHLWPSWHWLIDQCRPATVFGEQVASRAGLEWFDLVWTDLEAAGYAVGVSDLGAACVGAPHIRQRLWFVADTHGRNASAERLQRSGQQRFEPQDGRSLLVGKPESIEHNGSRYAGNGWRQSADASPWHDCDWLPCTDGKARPVEPGTFPLAHGIPGRVGRLRAYGNAIVPQVAAQFIDAFVNK